MSREDRPEPIGQPTTPELAQRLARVEEKQDHVVEKIDQVADSLDEELADVEATQQSILERNRKMWLAFQAAKWMGGPAGLLAVTASVLVL